MTEENELQLAEYVAWIDANYPEHDRTSCDDHSLYNAGSVTLRHRCERCESLSQLRYWRLVHNASGNQPQPPI